MKKRIEIDLSQKLYREMRLAAKNLKISPKRFVAIAIRRMANSNQHSGEEVTASLNKFFADNPDLNNIYAQQYWEN